MYVCVHVLYTDTYRKLKWESTIYEYVQNNLKVAQIISVTFLSGPVLRFIGTCRLDMVQLPGKRGRRVPMLLKPDWIKAMDKLVETRNTCKVTSQYFFGRPSKPTHLDAWQVKSFALETLVYVSIYP